MWASHPPGPCLSRASMDPGASYSLPCRAECLCSRRESNPQTSCTTVITPWLRSPWKRASLQTVSAIRCIRNHAAIFVSRGGFTQPSPFYGAGPTRHRERKKSRCTRRELQPHEGRALTRPALIRRAAGYIQAGHRPTSKPPRIRGPRTRIQRTCVLRAGLEPATSRLGIGRSIHLSHRSITRTTRQGRTTCGARPGSFRATSRSQRWTR